MVRLIGRGARELARTGVRLAAGALLSGVPAVAYAQPPKPPPADIPGPLVVHRDIGADAISLGRTRMAKGDCAGALEAFDAALRSGIDVTVHRDRGLCHEQLGHPFPAIDDFRIYLTAVPDAPDSDDIRTRLNQLEVANGLGGTGTGGTSAGAPAAGGKLADHEDPFAVDASKKGGTEVVAGSGDKQRAGNYEEELALNDQWDQAEGSPLRRGTGLSLGAYGRGYGGSANGLSGYGVGATLRGSISRVSTLYGEIGYATYRAGSDDDTGEREGGLTVGFGYEARIRLDELESNAIILAGILSYERVSDANTRDVYNNLNPRVKLGYRHVFGPGLGLEIGGELAQPLDLASGTAPVTYFGGTLALLVGF
jgi:hypothetical protein